MLSKEKLIVALMIPEFMVTAGIHFSLKYLKPAVERYKEFFDPVCVMDDPETVLYKIKGFSGRSVEYAH